MAWYFEEQGRRMGPIDDWEVEVRIRAGQLLPATRMCPKDSDAWVTCAEAFPDLMTAVKPAAGGPVVGGRIRHASADARPASVFARFAAKLLDGIVVGVLFTLLACGSGCALARDLQSLSREQSLEHLASATWRWQLASLLFSLLYQVAGVGLTGQTLGKRMLNIRVIAMDGRAAGFTSALVRAIGEYLSAIPLMLGYVCALFVPSRRALHDYLAGTRVIADE
jgi:uncharacterized RDD family membrane protein YckC